MSFAVRSMISNVIAYHGGRQTGTLRRRHKLIDRKTGQGAADLLAVQATTALGGSSLPIKTSSGTLKGVLPNDFTFTIAGNSTVYTLSAEATTTTAGVLTVAFTPVLAVEATLDVAITLGADYIEGTFSRLVSGFEAGDVNEVIEGRTRELHLSAEGAPWTPEEGDVWTDTGDTINRLRTIAPGAVTAGWSALIGGA